MVGSDLNTLHHIYHNKVELEWTCAETHQVSRYLKVFYTYKAQSGLYKRYLNYKMFIIFVIGNTT